MFYRNSWWRQKANYSHLIEWGEQIICDQETNAYLSTLGQSMAWPVKAAEKIYSTHKQQLPLPVLTFASLPFSKGNKFYHLTSNVQDEFYFEKDWSFPNMDGLFEALKKSGLDPVSVAERQTNGCRTVIVDYISSGSSMACFLLIWKRFPSQENVCASLYPYLFTRKLNSPKNENTVKKIQLNIDDTSQECFVRSIDSYFISILAAGIQDDGRDRLVTHYSPEAWRKRPPNFRASLVTNYINYRLKKEIADHYKNTEFKIRSVLAPAL